MRVVLNSNYATPHASGAPGDILNLPKDVANELIDNGYASKPGETGKRRKPQQGSGQKAPRGSIEKVLAWVDGDHAKAQTALDAELGRARQRPTLIEAFETLIDAGDSAAEEE